MVFIRIVFQYVKCYDKLVRQLQLWVICCGFVLFNPDYTVGILANKGQLAREILGRLQRAYEYLPLWNFNKVSLLGTKVI